MVWYGASQVRDLAVLFVVIPRRSPQRRHRRWVMAMIDPIVLETIICDVAWSLAKPFETGGMESFSATVCSKFDDSVAGR